MATLGRLGRAAARAAAALRGCAGDVKPAAAAMARPAAAAAAASSARGALRNAAQRVPWRATERGSSPPAQALRLGALLRRRAAVFGRCRWRSCSTGCAGAPDLAPLHAALTSLTPWGAPQGFAAAAEAQAVPSPLMSGPPPPRAAGAAAARRSKTAEAPRTAQAMLVGACPYSQAPKEAVLQP